MEHKLTTENFIKNYIFLTFVVLEVHAIDVWQNVAMVSAQIAPSCVADFAVLPVILYDPCTENEIPFGRNFVSPIVHEQEHEVEKTYDARLHISTDAYKPFHCTI